MTDLTREMVLKRLDELRNAQLEALTAHATSLGRLQECELLLSVLDKEEEVEAPSVPVLAEVNEEHTDEED